MALLERLAAEQGLADMEVLTVDKSQVRGLQTVSSLSRRWVTPSRLCQLSRLHSLIS